MDVFAQLLQALFVTHAEVLLFVDDEQPETRELDLLAQQRMGSDDDIDRAGLEALLDLAQILRRHQARGLRHLHRQPLEALGECAEMLARQKRRRHDDGDLHAIERRHECRAQGDFGLAEADVAAHETIHRASRAQVLDDGIDARRLVFGLFIREARNEFVVRSRRRHQGRSFFQLPQCCDLDQFGGDLAQPLLQPRLARLPGDAAELVELSVTLVGAEARQELDVLDRQEQLVAASIDQLEAIMRRAQRRDGLQSGEAADAMIGVHDEIADRQARRFGQHVRRASCLAPRPHETIAEDVLLADDGEFRRLEALLQTKHGEASHARRQRQRLGEALDLHDGLQAVIGQQRR